MIYVACLVIMVGSALLGKLMARRYVQRAGFYDELAQFLVYLKNDINFMQCKLGMAFDGYKSKSFAPAFLRLREAATHKRSLEKAKELAFLDAQELGELEQFFSRLGQGDCMVELGSIEAMQKRVELKQSAARKAKEQNAGLIYKLSLAVGVTICIIIV